MTKSIADDELAAAINALGITSKDGLSPQGEAAVRLALRCADLQRRLDDALEAYPVIPQFEEEPGELAAAADFAAEEAAEDAAEHPTYDPDEWKEPF